MASLRKSVSRGHTYWQIVESRRVNGRPRPIVLEHLGTAETLLKRLREVGQGPVRVKSLRFGAEAALWNMAMELDVVGIIDRYAPERSQGLSCGQYMLLAAINRCVAGTSKASLYRWYHKTVLQRLIPTSKRSLASQRFWDQMSYLDEKTIAAIERDIAIRLVRDFGVDLRTLLFDATNFDTFIKTQTRMLLAQRGHSKSKRSDLRVIGLALLVSTDNDIPLLSHVYPGNQNDSTTFGQIADQLAERYRQLSDGTEEITLVFDGGNTSEENMDRVDSMEYRFITSLTVTHHKDLLEVPIDKFEEFEDPRLEGTWAFRTTKEVWGKTRTIVVTYSENLMTGQIAGIEAALGKKRAALRDLRAKLKRSQVPGARGKGYTAETLEAQLKEITKGQYVSEILKAKIIPSDKALDFTFETDQAAYRRLMNTRLGKRILCTDNDSWTTQEIILGSRAQFHVENAFKQMKDPHWVRFSPAFHWTDQKLRVHAFYCILALTLAALLRRKAAKAGLNITVPRLLEKLSDIREIINLYPSQGNSPKGRFRAQYLIEDCDPIQTKLRQILDLDKLSRSKKTP